MSLMYYLLKIHGQIQSLNHDYTLVFVMLHKQQLYLQVSASWEQWAELANCAPLFLPKWLNDKYIKVEDFAVSCSVSERYKTTPASVQYFWDQQPDRLYEAHPLMTCWREMMSRLRSPSAQWREDIHQMSQGWRYQTKQQDGSKNVCSAQSVSTGWMLHWGRCYWHSGTSSMPRARTRLEALRSRGSYHPGFG